MNKEEWKKFEQETLNPIIINSINLLYSINDGYSRFSQLEDKQVKIIQDNISMILWLSEKL